MKKANSGKSLEENRRGLFSKSFQNAQPLLLTWLYYERIILEHALTFIIKYLSILFGVVLLSFPTIEAQYVTIPDSAFRSQLIIKYPG